MYTVWIQGHSSEPVLLDHYYPVGISIGNVNRDFSTSSGATVALATTGSTGTGSVTVSTPNVNGTYFGGTVNLSIEGGPDGRRVSCPSGIGAVSVSPVDHHPQQGHQPDGHDLGQRRDPRAGRLLIDAPGHRHQLGRSARHQARPVHVHDRDGQHLE